MRFPTVEFNNGNGWDSGRSTFVAPVDGVYFFSGEATAMITVGLSEQLDISIVQQNSHLDVRTHEKALGECRAHVGGRLGSNIAFAICSVAATLDLKKGNLVSLRAKQGYIAKSYNSEDERVATLVPTRAEFTGYLLQEALKN